MLSPGIAAAVAAAAGRLLTWQAQSLLYVRLDGEEGKAQTQVTALHAEALGENERYLPVCTQLTRAYAEPNFHKALLQNHPSLSLAYLAQDRTMDTNLLPVGKKNRAMARTLLTDTSDVDALTAAHRLHVIRPDPAAVPRSDLPKSIPASTIASASYQGATANHLHTQCMWSGCNNGRWCEVMGPACRRH